MIVDTNRVCHRHVSLNRRFCMYYAIWQWVVHSVSTSKLMLGFIRFDRAKKSTVAEKRCPDLVPQQ
ncbi:hypothetical protein BJX96DRAFT_147030 [Aspergillus floccosus]